METSATNNRYLLWCLSAFSATAVASISLQNLIWVAVLIFFYLRFRSKEPVNWPKGLFPFATLLFLSTFFLGAVVGVDPANSFHTVHKYLTFLMIFPLGAMALGEQEIRKLLLIFIFGTAICSIYGIGKYFFLHENRIDSFSGDKMVFGGLLMAGLLLTIWFLKNSPKNIWLWASFILILSALVLTQTRGAWIGAFAGFFLFSWRYNRKWLLAAAILIASAFFMMPTSLQNRVKSITDLNISYDDNHQIANSSQPRLLIWLSGMKIIKDHPWGIGQGNISDVFPRYRLMALNLYEPTVPHLHNNFLQVLVQNGWIGLIAYLFWIFSYYKTALSRQETLIELEGLNWIFLCVFSSVLVWGLTEYTFSHQFMNVQFFLLGLQLNFWALIKPNLLDSH